MRVSMPALTFSALCVLYGCGKTGPSGPLALPPPTSPQPVPVNGINGQYRGELAFTEEDTTYGWPAHLTVVANLRQIGTDVTGDFDLLEVPYSGGSVGGTVNPPAGDDQTTSFRADFWPNDLGDHFAIVMTVSEDGGRCKGTFVFADGIVGRGNATFIRLK